MEHESIERYLYAVTKQLPAKSRRDIERELRSLIGDMLEERCGDIAPTERDIRVVLTELGTPTDVGRILRTFKIKKNVEVTDNGKIII